MCYSAMVWQGYHSFIRMFGAKLSVEDFVRLFQVRRNDGKAKIPKGMEDAFKNASVGSEKLIYDLVRRYRDKQRNKQLTE
jgi:hypothetical protein